MAEYKKCEKIKRECALIDTSLYILLLSHLGEGANVGVESVLLEQVLEGEVHAVVPEMLWVRR